MDYILEYDYKNTLFLIMDESSEYELYTLEDFEISKYTEHEIKNYSNGRVFIVGSINDVDLFVGKHQSNSSNYKLYYGKINNHVADIIHNIFNLNIKNYNISLSVYALRHIIKNHSDINNEKLRGQLPITRFDFRLIPLIINKYDQIIDSGTTYEKKKVITFKKTIIDTYYVVANVSDKKHNLEIKTMYKKRNSATDSDE